MRVLVTGPAGHVARYVIEDLQKDHELVLIGRRHPSEVEGGVQTDARFIRGDLNSPEDCRKAVEGIDAIAHIGANPWLSPETFRNNTVGTYNLLEAAREAGIRRVVFASSNCALGHCAPVSGPFIPDRLPIDETHPSRVEDNYGLSKVVNEQTLDAFARGYGIESYALRLAWCWGDEQYSWRFDHTFDPAKHTGGFWAWVDMRDVAQAFRKALHTAPMPKAACVPLYINAADTMADETSAELLERFYPQLAQYAGQLDGHNSFFSWRAANAAIGYTPEHTWR
jgi:nucleoside-diphosphate-sugar epimerase